MTPQKKIGWLASLLLSFAISVACAVAAQKQTGQLCETHADAALAAPATAPGGDYIRFVRVAPDTYELRLAVRTFEVPHPKKRTKNAAASQPGTLRVTLVSAIHIGSSDYYAQLQKILDERKLLLFEGVSDSRQEPAKKKRSNAPKVAVEKGAAEATAPTEPSTPPAKKKRDRADEMDLYGQIAHACGLISQMHGIRYDREHFRSADMSVSQMRRLLKKEIAQGGEKAAEARAAEQLMEEAMGMLSGGMGGMEMFIMRGMLGMVKSSPRLRALFLLNLGSSAKSVEEADGGSWLERAAFSAPGMKRLQKLIIDDRNAVVMARLRKEIAQGKADDIGVFYGAAHMRDMETVLVNKMGARPVATEWLTAFTVKPEAAGVPAAVVRSFVGRQNMEGAPRAAACP